MAVNPDYQIVFQEDLVKANIGVIVNAGRPYGRIRADTSRYCSAFTATIPRNGKLVVMKDEFTDFC